MSEIERRGTREQRVERAYRWTLATGGFGIIGVVGIVLAIVGIIGAGLPVLALIIAAICFIMLRRSVR